MEVLITLSCFLFRNVFASYNVILEENSDRYDILRKFPVITITECYLQCNQNNRCSKTGIIDGDAEEKICWLLAEKVNETEAINEKEISTFKAIRKVGSHIIYDYQLKQGHYGNWSNFSEPIVSCGSTITRQSTRTRLCNNPAPAYGYDCIGPSIETKSCNLAHNCPGDSIKFLNPQYEWETGGCSIFGYIVVYYSDQWGTVCDDKFDDKDATVLCRMAGYNYGVYDGGEYEVGDGTVDGKPKRSLKIWLDDLECLGNETFIGDCTHEGWGRGNCGHSEDIGIKCYMNNS